MTFNVNQKVNSPIGQGYIQGRSDNGWIVRLPVNAITAARPSLTPAAHISGLWIFKDEELK